MKEIGGYFGLELAVNTPGGYHPQALALNTGRNALEYVLRSRGYNKVYLPDFYCDVMLEPIRKLGISYEFYPIRMDFSFEPFTVSEGECIVYINYFGVQQAYIELLRAQYPSLIVDNAQAFFEAPLPATDTYYSCRKFFGVPDGAYLYTLAALVPPLATDVSADRYRHLVGRTDSTAATWYADYQQSEHALCDLELLQMSPSTNALLQNISYAPLAARRSANYELLHKQLQPINQLSLPPHSTGICYPLLYDFRLKSKLIQNKIFVPTYWPNVLKECSELSAAYQLAENLICIPIDHRYNAADMERILKLILE
jgi:hypothetical protein